MKNLHTLLALIALSIAPAVVSAGDIQWAIADTGKHDYMVSGVLKKGSSEVIIKLFHSVEKARSGDEALGAATRKAMQEFPGYSVLSTLVTPIAQPACRTAI